MSVSCVADGGPSDTFVPIATHRMHRNPRAVLAALTKDNVAEFIEALKSHVSSSRTNSLQDDAPPSHPSGGNGSASSSSPLMGLHPHGTSSSSSSASLENTALVGSSKHNNASFAFQPKLGLSSSSHHHPNSQSAADFFDRSVSVSLQGLVMLYLKPNGMTLLHAVAANDSFAILSWLHSSNDLEEAAHEMMNQHTLDTKWTPLHFAAFNRKERICSYFRSKGADLNAEDIYGDKPSDIARMLGDRMLAESLGDQLYAMEEAQKSVAYQESLRHAKYFEEEQQRQKQEALRFEEEERLLLAEHTERQATLRQLKVTFEVARCEWIAQTWWIARESSQRECWIKEEQLVWGKHLLVLYRLEHAKLLREEERRAAERKAQEEEAARLAALAAKKKGKKGAKGKPAKKEPTTTTAPTAAAAAGATEGSDEANLENDPFFVPRPVLPEVTNNMSKDEVKEVQKRRQALLKEYNAAVDEMERKRSAMEDEHETERVVLIKAALEKMESCERHWFVGLGSIAQQDPTIDRRHPGTFRFDAFDRYYRWSCCEQKGNPFAVGCRAMPDTGRAKIHTGEFMVHVMDCPCGGVLVGQVNVNDTMRRANVRELIMANRSNSVASLKSITSNTSLHASPAQQQQGHQKKYCFPGGRCWSCCGAIVERAPGCSFPNRFVRGDHMIVDVRFDPCLYPLNPARDATEPAAAGATEGAVHQPTRAARGRSVSVLDATLPPAEASRATLGAALGGGRPSKYLLPQLVQPGLLATMEGPASSSSANLGESLMSRYERKRTKSMMMMSVMNNSGGQQAADGEGMQRARSATPTSHALDVCAAPHATTSATVTPSAQTPANPTLLLPIAVADDALDYINFYDTIHIRRKGRSIEHVGAPSSHPVNVLGNVVLRPDSLADIRAHEQKFGGDKDTLGSSMMAAASDIRMANSSAAAMPFSNNLTGNGGGGVGGRAFHDPSRCAKVAPTFGSRGVVLTELLGAHSVYGFELRLAKLPTKSSSATTSGSSAGAAAAAPRMVLGVVAAQLPGSAFRNDAAFGDQLDSPMAQRRRSSAWAMAAEDPLPSSSDSDEEEDADDFDGAVQSFNVSTTSFPSVGIMAAAGGNEDPMSAAGSPTSASQGKPPTVDGGSSASRSESPAVSPSSSAADPSTNNISPSNGKRSRNRSGAKPSSAAQNENSMFGVRKHLRKYFSDPSRFVAGPYGFGWWAETSFLRGLGKKIDTGGAVLSQGDLLLILVDALNDSLHFFLNRAYVASFVVPNFPSYGGFVPAATMAPGSCIEVEFYGAASLPYVDKWFTERAMTERSLRLSTPAGDQLEAKLEAYYERKRVESSRGAGGEASSGHGGAASGGAQAAGGKNRISKKLVEAARGGPSAAPSSPSNRNSKFKHKKLEDEVIILY